MEIEGGVGHLLKWYYLSIITGCLLFVFKKSYAVNYHSFHIFVVFHVGQVISIQGNKVK